MYVIRRTSFGPFTQFFIENTLTKEMMSCIPDCGCRLNQLRLSSKSQLIDVHWGTQDFEEYQAKQIPFYAGAFLFPFPNRLKNGKFNYQGKDFHFHANDPASDTNALHGLITEKPFKEIDSQCTSEFGYITFSYQNDGTHPDYNFPFDFRVSYTLSKDGLEVKTTVVNLGIKTLPFGIGWHPYLNTSGKLDHWLLKKATTYYFEVDQNLIPTGKKIPCQRFMELEPVLKLETDFCYGNKTNTPTAETILVNPVNNLQLRLWQDNDSGKLNYSHFFTPDDRTKIAIEPTTCPPDALNNTTSLLELESGKSYSCRMGINVQSQALNYQ